MLSVFRTFIFVLDILRVRGSCQSQALPSASLPEPCLLHALNPNRRMLL
jgi:hypothetical protein